MYCADRFRYQNFKLISLGCCPLDVIIPPTPRYSRVTPDVRSASVVLAWKSL
ncbi:hypothetical protein I79_002679 [Cricetulus griseus]|uniref:Uncharacterized protein n=1 Tax=Cricetulus griseus TaxID=10029 RepID=G3GY24_CRIGR|nr:hypothetical protein I79_002679 [Cricetulus griseus]